MFKSINKTKAASDYSSLEFISLDTLLYSHEHKSVEILYDREKNEDGTYCIFIDFAEITQWDTPSDEKINDIDKEIMYKDIMQTLSVLGIEGELRC